MIKEKSLSSAKGKSYVAEIVIKPKNVLKIEASVYKRMARFSGDTDGYLYRCGKIRPADSSGNLPRSGAAHHERVKLL